MYIKNNSCKGNLDGLSFVSWLVSGRGSLFLLSVYPNIPQQSIQDKDDNQPLVEATLGHIGCLRQEWQVKTRVVDPDPVILPGSESGF